MLERDSLRDDPKHLGVTMSYCLHYSHVRVPGVLAAAVSVRIRTLEDDA